MPLTLPPSKGPTARETPAYVELASEALLDGWTRAQAIDALLSRIRRDQHYLAYRRATGKHSVYDEETATDLRALALAACWLDESNPLNHQP